MSLGSSETKQYQIEHRIAGDNQLFKENYSFIENHTCVKKIYQVLYKMLPLKVLFLFIALAKANRCQDIQTIFYQTEDQYDAKGCDSNLKTNPFQISEFDKQCQLLQKKMDIFGQRFYDFGVSSTSI